MTDKDIAAGVREIVSECLGERGGLTDASHFVDELGADSLDLMEIRMAIEDKFQVDIDDDAATGVDTVGATIALVEKLVGAKA